MFVHALRLLALPLVLLAAPRASALSSADRARLTSGVSVLEEAVHYRNGARFVGGVAYRIVDADADRLSRIFRAPDRWGELLPRVREAQLTGIDADGRARVRVSHAVGPFSGGYSLVLAFTDQGRYGRFWVDRHEDNDLVDGWGFLRLTPLPAGKTLVTWAVLFDLGEGVTRALFEAKMQRAALDVPRRLAHAAAS